MPQIKLIHFAGRFRFRTSLPHAPIPDIMSYYNPLATFTKSLARFCLEKSLPRNTFKRDFLSLTILKTILGTTSNPEAYLGPEYKTNQLLSFIIFLKTRTYLVDGGYGY